MRVKQILHNDQNTMHQPHPTRPTLTHTHTITKCNCSFAKSVPAACGKKKKKKKRLALLVLFITVNRTDTPATLPFILISSLNDKPPQSHSLHLYPSNRTPPVWCRPSNKAATVLLCLSSSPPLFLPPHPTRVRCWRWRGPRHASTGTTRKEGKM